MIDAQDARADYLHSIMRAIDSEVTKITLLSGILRDMADRYDTRAAARILREAADEIKHSARRLEQLYTDKNDQQSGPSMELLPFR